MVKRQVTKSVHDIYLCSRSLLHNQITNSKYFRTEHPMLKRVDCKIWLNQKKTSQILKLQFFFSLIYLLVYMTCPSQIPMHRAPWSFKVTQQLVFYKSQSFLCLFIFPILLAASPFYDWCLGPIISRIISHKIMLYLGIIL